MVALLLILSFVSITRQVAVAHVFNNMPSLTHVIAFEQFWILAFEHTRIIVQVLTLTIAATAVYLAHIPTRTLVGTFSRA